MELILQYVSYGEADNKKTFPCLRHFYPRFFPWLPPYPICLYLDFASSMQFPLTSIYRQVPFTLLCHCNTLCFFPYHNFNNTTLNMYYLIICIPYQIVNYVHTGVMSTLFTIGFFASSIISIHKGDNQLYLLNKRLKSPG